MFTVDDAKYALWEEYLYALLSYRPSNFFMPIPQP